MLQTATTITKNSGAEGAKVLKNQIILGLVKIACDNCIKLLFIAVTDLNSTVVMMMMILTCTIMCFSLLPLSKGMEKELLGPEEDTSRGKEVFLLAPEDDYIAGKVRRKECLTIVEIINQLSREKHLLTMLLDQPSFTLAKDIEIEII